MGYLIFAINLDLFVSQHERDVHADVTDVIVLEIFYMY